MTASSRSQSSPRRFTSQTPPGGTPGLSRRRLVSGAGAMLAFRLTPGAAGAQLAPGTPVPWAYTDIHGSRVELPARPTRLVAMITPAAALWDFGVRPAGVFAWEAMMKPAGDDPAWGNIDAATVTNVSGGEAGNLDPERTLALGTDLIVTTGFDDAAAKYVQLDPALTPALNEIAPVVAVYGRAPADQNVARIAALAELLGADLAAPDLLAARAAFDATVASLRSVLAARPALRVLVINPGPDQFSLTAPRDFDDLAWFVSLGVTFVGMDLPLDTFWQAVSAEQAPLYPADVVLVNSIAGRLTAAELQAHPAYGQHPAIKAGQIGEWNQSYIPSYQELTKAVDRLLLPLRTAERLPA